MQVLFEGGSLSRIYGNLKALISDYHGSSRQGRGRTTISRKVAVLHYLEAYYSNNLSFECKC